MFYFSTLFTEKNIHANHFLNTTLTMIVRREC